MVMTQEQKIRLGQAYNQACEDYRLKLKSMKETIIINDGKLWIEKRTTFHYLNLTELQIKVEGDGRKIKYEVTEK